MVEGTTRTAPAQTVDEWVAPTIRIASVRSAAGLADYIIHIAPAWGAGAWVGNTTPIAPARLAEGWGPNLTRVRIQGLSTWRATLLAMPQSIFASSEEMLMPLYSFCGWM